MMNRYCAFLTTFLIAATPVHSASTSLADAINTLQTSPRSALRNALQFADGPQRQLFYHAISNGGIVTDTYKSICAQRCYTNPRALLEQECPSLYEEVRSYLPVKTRKKMPFIIFLVDGSNDLYAHPCINKENVDDTPFSVAVPVTEHELKSHTDLAQLLAVKIIIALARKKAEKLKNSFSDQQLLALLASTLSHLCALFVGIALDEHGHPKAATCAFIYSLMFFPMLFGAAILHNKYIQRRAKKIEATLKATPLTLKTMVATLKRIQAQSAHARTPASDAYRYYQATHSLPSKALTDAQERQVTNDDMSDEAYLKKLLWQDTAMAEFILKEDATTDAATPAQKESDTPPDTPAA